MPRGRAAAAGTAGLSPPLHPRGAGRAQPRARLATSSSASSPLRPGVNAMLRKVAVAAASKPHVEIRQDGDQFYIKTSTTVRTTEINFKIGESFEEETVDGRKCRVGGELGHVCMCVCYQVLFRLNKHICCQCPQIVALLPSTLFFLETLFGGSRSLPFLFSLVQHSPSCRVKLKSEGNRAWQVPKAEFKYLLAGSSGGRVLFSSFCFPLPWRPQLQWKLSPAFVPDGNTGNRGARETSRVRI